MEIHRWIRGIFVITCPWPDIRDVEAWSCMVMEETCRYCPNSDNHDWWSYRHSRIQGSDPISPFNWFHVRQKGDFGLTDAIRERNYQYWVQQKHRQPTTRQSQAKLWFCPKLVRKCHHPWSYDLELNRILPFSPFSMYTNTCKVGSKKWYYDKTIRLIFIVITKQNLQARWVQRTTNLNLRICLFNFESFSFIFWASKSISCWNMFSRRLIPFRRFFLAVCDFPLITWGVAKQWRTSL